MLTAMLVYGWVRINRMEERQRELREETLPNQYIRKDGVEALQFSINKLAESFEGFRQHCLDGKCVLARIVEKNEREKDR